MNRLSFIDILNPKRTKDLFSVLGPSFLGAFIIYIYLFPELPSLQHLLLLSTLTIIVSLFLNSIWPLVLDWFTNPRRLLKNALKKTEFQKIEREIKEVLVNDPQILSLAEKLITEYKRLLEKYLEYELKNLHLRKHYVASSELKSHDSSVGYDEHIIATLNIKEIRLEI